MTYEDESNHSGALDVDICATLLTDTPPKLPLREELPSLGFEVIYHASGVGVKASKHAAKRAAKQFRKMQEKRDKKKWRLLPRTAKQIQKKLDIRKQQEDEILHSRSALSYDSYNSELKDGHEDTESNSSSSGSSVRSLCESKTSSLRNKRKHKKKAPHKTNRTAKKWNVFKTSKVGSKFDANKSGPTENGLEKVDFPDVLTPMNLLNDSDQTDEDTRDDISGSSYDNHSFAYSSISSVHWENDPEGVKMLFVTSRSTRKYLPEITSTDESDHGSQNKGGSDADTEKQQVTTDYNLCTETYAIAHSALDSALEKAFPDFLGSFESMEIGFGSRPTSPVPGPGSNEINLKKQENGSDDKSTSSSAVLDDDIKNAFNGVDMLFTAGSDVLGAAGEVIVDGGIALGRLGSGVIDTISNRESGTTVDQKSQKEVEGSHARIKDDGQSSSRLSSDWLSAAVSAFGNIAIEFYNNAAGLSDEKNIDFLSGTGTIEDLFDVLGNFNASIEHVQNILSFSPEYIQIKRHLDRRLPLHVLCDRGFPDRSTVPVRDRMHLLLQDVGNFRDIVFYVKNLYPDACLAPDAAGDLPVHLLARTFMCWEAQWYEAVYEEAAKDQQSSAKTSVAITYLYQLMSECVEFLLEAVMLSSAMCKLPGSVGQILPLHIASIFTSSVRTLRIVLRTFPEAASIKCDLGEMKTFVPNHVIPLELHDLLSTDFPKWEIQSTGVSNELSWSVSRQSKNQDVEDCIRRSDLLFAFNPISPYRYEKSRIRRLESRIEYEAKQVAQGDRERMSYASELTWMWMCTFSEEKTGTVTYLNSVKRIANTLQLQSLKYLMGVKNDEGQRVFDIACRNCIVVLQRRLDKLTENTDQFSGHDTNDASGVISKPSSSISKVWHERQSAQLSFKKKGVVNHLCRLIFNMSESSFPTSFIILPYKLTIDDKGVLGVESSANVDVALQFADHLLEMTDPRSMLYYLDAKSTQYYGESLYGIDENPNRFKAYEAVNASEEALLSLYKPGEAYMYLVDEITGIPVLSLENDEYPIVLNDSVNLVRKLLPLMLIGMLQLRGEKSLSVMVSILLDGSVATVPPKWVDAAKEAGIYVNSLTSNNGSSTLGTSNTADELVRFVSESKNKLRSSNKPKNGSTEWNVELSILKMLLDMNDKNRCYDGLQAMKLSEKRVLWTKGDVKDKTTHATLNPSVKGGSPQQGESKERPIPDIFRKSEERSDESSHASTQQHTNESSQTSLPYTSKDSESAEGLNFPQPYLDGSFGASGSNRNEPLLPYFNSYDSDELQQTLPKMDPVRVFLPQAKREELFPRPRYTFLFDKLAIQTTIPEHREDVEVKRTFDEGGRIWSEISSQLERGFYEDASILRLRVDIAEEAKHISYLNKKMHDLLELHKKIILHKGEDFMQWEWSRNGCNTAGDTRKLILRLCDLEDRILLDEIDLQHVTIRAYALAEDVNWVDNEGDEGEGTKDEEIELDRIILSRDEADAEEQRKEGIREPSDTCRRSIESSLDSFRLNSEGSEPERSCYQDNKTRRTQKSSSQHSSTASLWSSSKERYNWEHVEEAASWEDNSDTDGNPRLPTSISFQQALREGMEANSIAEISDYDQVTGEGIEI